MKIRGRVWKYGDDINTDELIPARYLNLSRASELARHCLEDLDRNFVKKAKRGDIIVAGKNFGCGSSREHAPLAIKELGIACIIAGSFARIFYRNAINIGLPIFESEKAVRDINKRDMVSVDLDKGEIKNLRTGKTYASQTFPDFMQGIIKAGGLMKWIKK